MKKKYGLIIISVLTITYMVEVNAKTIKLYPSHTVSKIETKNIQVEVAIPKLIHTNEKKFSEGFSKLYKNLVDNKGIDVTKNFAKYALILKKMVLLSCQENPENAKIQNELLTALNRKKNNKSIQDDLDSLKDKQTLVIPQELFPLLYISELICSEASKIPDDLAFEIKLNKAGYQKGTSVILNDSLETNELMEEMANKFGMTRAEWIAEKKISLDNIKTKGYLPVPDAQVGIKIDDQYNLYKDKLKNIDEIKEELAFNPELINDAEFNLLGSEAGNTKNQNGYTGVVSVYDSPIGKLVVSEKNLRLSEGSVFIEPEFINTKIGSHDAVLLVVKGKESGRTRTTITWYNKNTGRNYKVETNLNINDPKFKKQKNILLGMLTKQYGN